MREIIYIQAGKLANYTGTHFWNAQESYLATDPAGTIYDSDLSFREGLSPTGSSTYCPRLLVFDHKSNFGTLSKSNALVGADEDEISDVDPPTIWNGHVAEYKQDIIPKSAYHSSLDSPNDSGHADQSGDTEYPHKNVRYWSDFNRVYYVPKTIQRLPDPAEWENVEGDWNHGQSAFTQYDEDHAVTDGSLRSFFEECDSPQGLHIMNDTSTFGGFMNSFLTVIRDQYTKLPCLVVPFLSTGITRQLEGDKNSAGIKNVINDALYLRSLNETASMSIPIQPTISWPSKLWSKWLCAQPENIYHNSAIVSAMLESVTVPLRLRGSQIDLSSLSSKLNWRGNTPFSELSGIFPFKSAADFDTRLANLSAFSILNNSPEYSQLTRFEVSRGFTPSIKSAYDDWSSRQSLDGAFVSSVHTQSYPIPTSYPTFFNDVEVASSPRKGVLVRPEHCSMFSSLAVSSQTALMFSLHASAIDRYLKRKPAVETLGFDGDDLRDLVNDLWTLHDNFDSGTDSDSSIGEDEIL